MTGYFIRVIASDFWETVIAISVITIRCQHCCFGETSCLAENTSCPYGPKIVQHIYIPLPHLASSELCWQNIHLSWPFPCVCPLPMWRGCLPVLVRQPLASAQLRDFCSNVSHSHTLPCLFMCLFSNETDKKKFSTFHHHLHVNFNKMKTITKDQQFCLPFTSIKNFYWESARQGRREYLKFLNVAASKHHRIKSLFKLRSAFASVQHTPQEAWK